MRKKKAAALLAMAVLLSACGTAATDSQVESSITEESAVPKMPSSPGQEAADSVDTDSDEDAKEEASKEEKKKSASSKNEFTEQVIYEQDGLKVTATGLEESRTGIQLKLTVENSADCTYIVQARNVSANGIMVDPSMSIDVAAGKKANGKMRLSSRELEDAGISQIHSLEFNLHIFPEDDFMDGIDSDLITLTLSDGEESKSVDGEVLYDADGLKIISTGLKESELFGTALGLYLENSSDQALTVQCRDLSINGIMIDGVFSCDLMPGKKAYDEITVFSSQLEENDIEEIENAELSFHIVNADDWSDSTDSDPITINY